MTERKALWTVIEAVVLRMRAEAGDAHETASDVAEWQADVRHRLEVILLDAGHPTQDRLDDASDVRFEMTRPMFGASR